MTRVFSASRLGLGAFALALGIAAQAVVAADAVGDERSVPGTVVPSTGTTAGAKAVDAAPVGNASRGASSSSDRTSLECRAMRRRYAQSQACFGRYRLANGGLKPEAFKHCKQLENPAVKCGSAIVE